MPYDEELATRARAALAGAPRVVEKRMFGGIAFMVRDRMAVGVSRDDLLVRVDPEDGDRFVKEKGARPMDFTGKPMRGFLFVAPEGTRTAAGLKRWILRALAFNARVPRKPSAGTPRRKRTEARPAARR